jgi:hypothetical protein
MERGLQLMRGKLRAGGDLARAALWLRMRVVVIEARACERGLAIGALSGGAWWWAGGAAAWACCGLGDAGERVLGNSAGRPVGLDRSGRVWWR